MAARFGLLVPGSLSVMQCGRCFCDALKTFSVYVRGTPIVIALLLPAWGLPACRDLSAGLLADTTEFSISSDNRFILIHIGREPLENQLSRNLDAATLSQIRRIHDAYTQDGLYRNDGSTTPLWAYDGVLGVNQIVASDGQHVIVEGAWTYDEYAVPAVTFVRKGKVLRSYQDTELIPHWKLKAILSRAPPSCAATHFDPVKMTYTIKTNQHEEIVFDVKTGDILEVRSPFTLIYGLALMIPAIVILIVVRQQLQPSANHSGARGT